MGYRTSPGFQSDQTVSHGGREHGIFEQELLNDLIKFHALSRGRHSIETRSMWGDGWVTWMTSALVKISGRVRVRM